MKRVLRTRSYDVWQISNGKFVAIHPSKRPSKCNMLNDEFHRDTVDEVVQMEKRVGELMQKLFS